MRTVAFEPCIPTRATKVPAGPDWLIKHDGYRLIIQREGKRVRLFTRHGHDWTGRYPLIVEAALESMLMIDGDIHYPVMEVSPEDRRNREKVNEAVRRYRERD